MHRTPLKRSRLSVTPAHGRQSPSEECPHCHKQVFWLPPEEVDITSSGGMDPDDPTPTRAPPVGGPQQAASTADDRGLQETTGQGRTISPDDHQPQLQTQARAKHQDELRDGSERTAQVGLERQPLEQPEADTQDRTQDESPDRTMNRGQAPTGEQFGGGFAYTNAGDDDDDDTTLPDTDLISQVYQEGTTEATTDATDHEAYRLASSQLIAELEGGSPAPSESHTAPGASGPTPAPAAAPNTVKQRPKQKAASKVVKPTMKQAAARRKKGSLRLIKATAHADGDEEGGKDVNTAAGDHEAMEDVQTGGKEHASTEPPSPQPQSIARTGLVSAQTTLERSHGSAQIRFEMKMTKMLAETHYNMPDHRIQACVRKACSISKQATLDELRTSLAAVRQRQVHVDSRALTFTCASSLDISSPESQLAEGFRAAWWRIQSIGSDLFIRTVVYRSQLAELHRIYTAWQAKCYSTAKQSAFRMVYPKNDPAEKAAWTRFDNELRFAAKMARLEEVLGRGVFVMLPSSTFPHEFFRILPIPELETWARMVKKHCWPEESFPPRAMSVVQALLCPDEPSARPLLLECMALVEEGDSAQHTRFLQESGAVQHVDVVA